MNAPTGGGASEELLTVDLFRERVSLRIGTPLINHVSVDAQLPTPVHILPSEIEHSEIIYLYLYLYIYLYILYICVCIIYIHINL